jgi:hypothetical protein
MKHGIIALNLLMPLLLTVAFVHCASASTILSDSMLIGTNYSHYRITNCSMKGTGILANYHNPSVRSIVREQLATMRTEGKVETLRLIVWHVTDPRNNDWGVIPSPKGELLSPYRENLIHFVSDIKKAGYLRLTVCFGPMGSNSPLSRTYKPEKLGENWAFIKKVRGIVKQYGPSDTHFDLLNEGAPSKYNPAHSTIEKYIGDLYSKYVKAYGNADVTISALGPSRSKGAKDRISNLIHLLRATQLAQPRWYEIHIGLNNTDALSDLLHIRESLQQEKVNAPLIIGETTYNSPEVAEAIKEFITTFPDNRIGEVIQWPRKSEPECKDISETPPYSVRAYVSRLKPEVKL